MSVFNKHIAPRMIEYSMTRPFWASYRRRVLAPATGDVLEIGFGTGVNLDFYPDTIDSLTIVEPDAAMLARASSRISTWSRPFTAFNASAETLPFEDATFDTVVTTLTLCSVDMPDRALAEIRRVLKTGGHYLYLEHGLADDPRVIGWQNRLNGLCASLTCGCHLNRDMSALIAGAGFTVVEMSEDYAPGMPRISGLVTEGLARRA